VKDVGDWIGGFDEIKTIQITQGICNTPQTLSVRKFKPKHGDVLYRRWDHNGRIQKHVLPAYALANVNQAADNFQAYISRHAVESLSLAVQDSADIVKRTYSMVVDQLDLLSVCPPTLLIEV
jgi:hypothetical protein